MNLYIRLLKTLILVWFFRPGLGSVLDVSRLTFRVWPNDLDLNGHMNNGRYLTVADLGRLDLILRTKLWRLVRRHKGVPILAAAQIRYRLPLRPFERFALESRVVCWDERFVYLEQRFIHLKGPTQGAVAAIALLKGGFYDKSRKGVIPTAEMLGEMGESSLASPDMPAYVADWLRAEGSLRAVTAAPSAAA